MKQVSCKVGTKPELIQLYRGYKIREGLKIRFRRYGYHDWEDGLVWKVNPDGFFFVSQI